MKAKVFNYKILEVKPIDALHEFKDHRRLQVFYHKGCKCINCGLEATQIALGEGRGQKHWDLYTADFYPLTVDHIIPKSRGGSDELENKQPMCASCNRAKGSRIEGESWAFGRLYDTLGHFCKWPRKQNVHYEKFIPSVGDEVYRRSSVYTFKYLGVVSQIVINPHTGKNSFMLKGNLISMHGMNNAYRPI